ncbi:hypothetical protein [Paenibacillus oceani]|uniref:Uncharacterized protein n=1 Tax=Paenibacillus oceani TaxID=2772510 RepID=A0A927CBI8_9BACL|nr:hypothetical protein [Paenibacillus oceani]MBD2865019.1 hypothetical protein [Paenibacillus oceani]
MTLCNCRDCGVLFVPDRVEVTVCRDCERHYDRMFDVVRELVRNDSRMTIQQLADKTNIPSQQLWEWVRNGRIHFQ